MAAHAKQSDWIDHLHIWLDNNQGLALWLTGVVTSVLAVGVIIAWFAIRDAKKTRHAQLIIDLDARWEAPSLIASQKLLSKYTATKLAGLAKKIFDPKAPAPTAEEMQDYESVSAVANLIETIGVLTRMRGITKKAVYRVWGGPIVDAWRVWEPVLPQLRKDINEEHVFEHFEKIGKAMVNRLPETGRWWARFDR